MLDVIEIVWAFGARLFLIHRVNFYYWFGVGEGTLQIHYLISEFTPMKIDMLQTLPPPNSSEKTLS
jgi:hypothetical protein